MDSSKEAIEESQWINSLKGFSILFKLVSSLQKYTAVFGLNLFHDRYFYTFLALFSSFMLKTVRPYDDNDQDWIQTELGFGLHIGEDSIGEHYIPR
jgi:hypothetical protein